MERRPVILILTSSGEYGNVSSVVAEAVRGEGSHNVVVLDESKYDSRTGISALDRLMQVNDEYKLVADKRMTAGEAFRYDRASSGGGHKKLSRRNRRIANAVKRYRPEFILALTPYACAAAAEARRKTGFFTDIVYVMNGFVVHGEGAVHDADCYIVENSEMKETLTQRGVPSRKVMVMGLPFDAVELTPIEREARKQELGLPKTPTVFLNARKKEDSEELLGLLTDQGSILNTVCYTRDVRDVASLRAVADADGGCGGVIVLTKEDLFEEYLSVSDIVVTSYDPSVLYKCFKTGKSVIVAERTGSKHDADLDYLTAQGLILRASHNIDTVALIYKLMQTDTAAQFAEKGEQRTEMFSLSNLAGYLTGYISTRSENVPSLTNRQNEG